MSQPVYEATATVPPLHRRSSAPSWALGCGLLSLGTGFITGIPAVVFGIVGLNRTREHRGWSIFGIVMGTIAVMFSGMIIAGWAMSTSNTAAHTVSGTDLADGVGNVLSTQYYDEATDITCPDVHHPDTGTTAVCTGSFQSTVVTISVKWDDPHVYTVSPPATPGSTYEKDAFNLGHDLGHAVVLIRNYRATHAGRFPAAALSQLPGMTFSPTSAAATFRLVGGPNAYCVQGSSKAGLTGHYDVPTNGDFKGECGTHT